MRLNGWMPTGIVLSLIWLVGGTAYYWIREGEWDNAFRDDPYLWAAAGSALNCSEN
jgi:hypothetical protein